MPRHALKPCVQVVAGGGVDIRHIDLTAHFILKLCEQGGFFRVNFHLNIHKAFKVFVCFIGAFFHQLRKCFAAYILADNCPFAVLGSDTENFRYIKPCFLNSRLIERFVQYICLGIAVFKHLYNTSAVLIYRFTGANRNYFIKLHISVPFPVRFFRVCRNRRSNTSALFHS